MSTFAEIVLPMPVDQPYTYAVPKPLQARVAVGMRALVPLRNRLEAGYVVGLANATDVKDTRPIAALPDEGPVFSPGMLELCRWMADYYCCSWGEALHSAVPAGIRLASEYEYRLLPDNLQPGRFTKKQQDVVALLYRSGAMTERTLAVELGKQELRPALDALVRRGVVEAVPVVATPQTSIRTETWVRLVEANALDADQQAALQRRAPKQASVYFDLLHGAPERAATELYAKHQVNATVLRALESRMLVERYEREYYRAPDISGAGHAAAKLVLNEAQVASFETICRAFDEGSYATFLLQGITGSGKTEVYLQVIEHALSKGRDAILLVPEISLTPQTVGRLLARFEQQIAVLHSGLSAGERYDEWRRALRGEVRIVVGARSAIFAPLPDVGVIVVDEEHDGSYKQAETPRYHARDVAVMRAKMNNAVCILGSATPSLESYHNTVTGKFARLELPRRATASTLPAVKIIDLREEAKEAKGQCILARELEHAVRQRVADGEQVILLLNRRGFSPFVLCPQCGWVAGCDDCQVSMTYHSVGAVLRCHYCNATQPRPEVCGACHFNPLIYLGTGTQKAEDYLMRTFAGSRVARMDADTTSGRGGHAKILGRFAAGEIDVLIGTQMLAKGHDYPGVTLVGVINADTGLYLPDFRAAESTFQLLTQVAGRAGRGERPGEVYFQTYRPKHFAVQAAARHDYAAFYEEEIRHREHAGYPPFRRMVNLALESEDPQAAERAAVALRRIAREQIETLAFKGVTILGPAPAAIKRVRKKYRWHLALLSRSASRLNILARAVRDRYLAASHNASATLKVDPDPYGAF